MNETSINASEVVATPEPVNSSRNAFKADPLNPTAPCEICGKDISTARMPRLNHMKACSKKNGVQADQATGEVPSVNRPLPSTEDEDLLADIKYARQVAERRRQEAPELAAGTAGIGSMFKHTVKRLTKQGMIPHGMHPFFGDPSLYRTYISQGYEPVVEAGRQVMVHDMPLFILPKEAYEAHEQSTINLSTRLLEEQLAKAMERTKMMVGEDGKPERSTLEHKDVRSLGENINGGDSNPGEPPMGG